LRGIAKGVSMISFKNVVKSVLRIPANLFVSSSTNLEQRMKHSMRWIIMEEPTVTAKFLPYLGGIANYILEPIAEVETSGNKGLPVPPKDLWQGYGRSTEDFLLGAKNHFNAMNETLAQSDFPLRAGYRILDFGCGAGRMIRQFEDVAADREIWGVDINAEHIIWCQRNLSPPFHFATTTTLPHLPFEDRYFDFIYAGSIFTHIADLADAWLLELRRVTRPNGMIYITLHDNTSIRILRESDRQPWLTDMLKGFERTTDITHGKFSMFTLNRGPNSAQVFYDIDYFRRKWNRLFRIRSVTQEGHGYQTAVLLER
jgi:ubiquinone/menaquinone biosynthesis C-methylase UbiE